MIVIKMPGLDKLILNVIIKKKKIAKYHLSKLYTLTYRCIRRDANQSTRLFTVACHRLTITIVLIKLQRQKYGYRRAVYILI